MRVLQDTRQQQPVHLAVRCYAGYVRARLFFASIPCKASPGLHHAVRILAGTTAGWLLFRACGDANPVWVVFSLTR